MKYNREKYVEALRAQVEQNIFFHSLALEACLAGIYDYLAANDQLGGDEPARAGRTWLCAQIRTD